VTELAPVPTNVDGRALSKRGARTRQRLLEAAEQCFSELGYNDASIVKITEAAGVAQGTFYLYFAGKLDIFEEVVLDLNSRVRHAIAEASKHAHDRGEAELLGFRAFFRFTAEHPALYRVIRQAEFASPRILQRHYERFGEGYVAGLRDAMGRGEIEDADAEMLAWALMGVAELIGMKTVLWSGAGAIAEEEFDALAPLVLRLIGARDPAA
jgi:AcrR family transcriptional regulator